MDIRPKQTRLVLLYIRVAQIRILHQRTCVYIADMQQPNIK